MPNNKRKTVYIRKRFQADFAVKFLALIVVEAVLAVGVLGYLAMGTVVTGYSGGEVVVAGGRDYFLPAALLANLVIIGVTAVAGFIVLLFVSHKLAGPLYRFEKSLEEIAKGDLTHRFRLREGDEMNSLAERLNEFNSKMEELVGRIQRESDALGGMVAEMRALLDAPEPDKTAMECLMTDARERLDALDRAAKYFKTSKR
ncbi:MAG: HAMP domain-containing protein [Deltaproteobacteria bacterium]|nr:HAMP domain-containing protein [Deltaproteobacteria bacterium]